MICKELKKLFIFNVFFYNDSLPASQEYTGIDIVVDIIILVPEASFLFFSFLSPFYFFSFPVSQFIIVFFLSPSE